MDLKTLAGIVVGAVVSLVTTALVERTRWKRTLGQEGSQILRESYVDYLAALAQSHEGIRVASLRMYDGIDERTAAIMEAFSGSDLYQQRFRLTMLAPPRVVELGVHALRQGRRMRDLLAEGAGLDSAPFRDAQTRFYEAVQAASDEMRGSLDIAPLGFMPMGWPPDRPPADPVRGSGR
ncbi:hypothetical protein ACFYYR_12260 [Streptomyces sp. NPDC001922]|uniref:hypothetical protein n=1 Tax=Streptomyces sp. NPDC001922 TaxID=3364624 RepID=UPI0036A3B6D3